MTRRHSTGTDMGVRMGADRWLAAPLVVAGILACTALLFGGSAIAQFGLGTPAAGCTLHDAVYSCDADVFHSQLAAAHTVAVRADPMDRQATAQLGALVRTLGKKLVRPDAEQPPDMVFELLPAAETGISFGPADQPLAVFRVYAPARGEASSGSHNRLLWAEIFRGQPDRPWPSDVGAVIEQFRAHVTRH